jgi:hypothetical protein
LDYFQKKKLKNVDNFINGYGQTEITVDSNYKILKESDRFDNIGML